MKYRRCHCLIILLRAIPWLFTRHVIAGSLKIISSEKGLFIFRQIRPIDLIIAKVLSELQIMTVVFSMLLIAMNWYGICWEVHDLLFWLGNILVYIFFIAGIALFIAVLGFFFKFSHVIIKVSMRALYMLSGIFFSSQMIPLYLRKYLLLNPVFQIVEISRECFSMQHMHEKLVDPMYVFKCAIVALVLGLGSYISCRNRIMVEIANR